jgi:hypothetical protein
MTEREMQAMWVGIFEIGKGITYILAMMCMIKYLFF